MTKGVDKLKEELNQLRVAKVAGGTSSKLGRIRVIIKIIIYLYFLIIGCQKIYCQIFDCY